MGWRKIKWAISNFYKDSGGWVMMIADEEQVLRGDELR